MLSKIKMVFSRDKNPSGVGCQVSGGFFHVHLLDTSIASDNIGDEIIVESCRRFIREVFPNAYITTSSSHDGLNKSSREFVADANIVFLLGTNALAPFDFIKRDFIWRLSAYDLHVMRNKVVLLGVGANIDAPRIDPVQSKNLKSLLHKDFLHSVRDETGFRFLNQIGVPAINTSCPTLWVTELPKIRVEKSDSVVFTLTKHKASRHDKTMIRVLRSNYSKLFFWPQQPRDYIYLKELEELYGVEVVSPNLYSYDQLLEQEIVDVVGTRLHGTIRGLQHGHRGVVISIDNRARDISREVGLLSVERECNDFGVKLTGILNDSVFSNIDIPVEEIRGFRKQFECFL